MACCRSPSCRRGSAATRLSARGLERRAGQLSRLRPPGGGRRRTSALCRSPSAAPRLAARARGAGAASAASRALAAADWAHARGAARRSARAPRRRPDAQAPRFRLRHRPAARRLVEVEGRSVDRRRGAGVRAGGQRPARQSVHRLHLRGLAGRRAGADRQGLFRPDRRGDSRARPLDPAPHGRALRPGPAGRAGAGVRARLRGHQPLAAPQVGHRAALSADRALAHRQAGARGRPAGRRAGAAARVQTGGQG